MSDPAPNPGAEDRQKVVVGHARFTVLTSALIRMEWSPDCTFEGRASQLAINRRLAVPDFEVERDGPTTVLNTDVLELRFVEDGRAFHQDNLTVRRRDWAVDRSWRPGDAPRGNLRGTARTLDDVSGATDLERGILSRDGWAVLDDSAALVFEPDYETGRLTLRGEADDGALDWYFFGYGHDYPGALRDFTRLAGPIPLPPRFVFGTWWSRYWAYSDEELKSIVRGFEEHDLPLDVLVVDMDWHLDGWTGYTWNRTLFPDPDEFLQWCHDRNLRVTLNLHPADGVGKHEAAFESVARDLGLDPESTARIDFNCTDPVYMRAYFERLHHPLERQGVDFWWIDWQQGATTAVAGLDPLWQLNHLHWRDMATNDQRGDRRPLIFSRWGGPGQHRYPIGFSGDTHSDWESLAFQPHFTATASNVGYAYWSHDIGGHYQGPVEPELYLRWIQYGVFSPVMRTHTTKHPEAERRIWEFPTIFEAAREALQLRMRLVPYIYAAARQAHDTGVGLCRPMYYEWPEHDEAYAHPNQYMFGDDLLVAPVLTPVDAETGTVSLELWLPPGTWCHFFTGETFEGDRVERWAVELDEIPVFVRAGAIVPFAQPTRRTRHIFNHLQMVRIFPGAAGEATYYEDDCETTGYVRGECAFTSYRQRRLDPKRHRIDIDAVRGGYPGMAERREYIIELMGFGAVEAVRIDGESIGGFSEGESRDWWVRDEVEDWALIALVPRDVHTPIRLEIELA